MSRIGKSIISIPEKVEVKVDNSKVSVTGPKGSLECFLPVNINLTIKDKTILLERKTDNKKDKSLHGLWRVKISNMVFGVSEGYSKDLEIIGVGYRAQLKGKNLELNLGYSHPVVFNCVDGISFSLEGQTNVKVSGIDKELIGAVASKIRSLRSPEPYKGKGIRYKGEYIRKKAGKAGKTGGKK